MIPKLAPQWQLREQALPACAVLALGNLARARLQAWLAKASDPDTSTHYEQLIFDYPAAESSEPVLGALCWLSAKGVAANAVLPWFDGAFYVGAEADCSQLWLPCSHAPNLPAAWLHAAAQRRTAAARHLLWPTPALLVALA